MRIRGFLRAQDLSIELGTPVERPPSRRLRRTARVVGLGVAACSAATAAVGIHLRGSADGPAPVGASGAVAPVLVRPAETATPSSDAPGAAKIRVIPLIHGVDPTPATPPKRPRDVPAASQQGGAPAASGPAPLTFSSTTPTDCLPAALQSVLQDLQTRFGAVTLVATAARQTEHHAEGSLRRKLHADCRAVDFKVAADLAAVTAYLRARSSVAISVFPKSGVIHLESTERGQIASGPVDPVAPERARRRAAAPPLSEVHTAETVGFFDGESWVSSAASRHPR